MAKRFRWLVWPLVYVLPVVLVFFLAFAFVSAPFTPPADSEPPPIVRKFPLAQVDDRPQSDEEGVGIALGDTDETVQSEEGDSRWVTALVAEFYSRQTGAPESVENYVYGEIRRDFFDIGYVVLQGEESHETLMRLVRDPDQSVRIEAMKALGQAQNALMQDGYGAMLRLWHKLDAQQTDAVVAAACETLLQETLDGKQSFMPWFLYSMGDPGHEALPLVVWVSNHHPDANMRVFTFNMTWMMDSSSPLVDDLRRQRLLDPSGIVRLNALQEVTLRTAAGLIGIEGNRHRTATSEAAPKAL